MADYTFGPQAAVDIATGEIVQGEGMSGQVYATLADAEAETSPLSVVVAGGVSSTEISVSSVGQTALFVTQHPAVYWRSGNYVVLLIAIDSLLDSAEKAAWTVNGVGVDESHNIQVDVAAGVDDAGMAELVQTPTSALALALAELYGVGFQFLDLGETSPPGTPDGTVILRSAGGSTPPPTPVLYMYDDFERTVAPGDIGAPSSGGSYWSLTTAADWSVSGGAARWVAPGAGAQNGAFRSDNYSQPNVEIFGVVSQASGDTSNRNFAIIPRRIPASNDQYAVNIMMRGPNATRPLQIDLALQKGVNEGDLQAALGGALATGSLGERINFRARVTQVDAATTRVQARIWAEGAEEPAIWQRDMTDTTPALQAPGGLEVRIRQANPEVMASEARLHGYTVQSVI